MIIAVTCYKIWGHINVLVAVYADILWSRRGSYAYLKCVSSQFMEELLEELWTLWFLCSSYMTLTSLLTPSVSPLSEGRRAFQHYRVHTASMLYWSSSLSLKDGLYLYHRVNKLFSQKQPFFVLLCSPFFRRWHLLKGRSSRSADPQTRQNCSCLACGSLSLCLYLLCPSQTGRVIFVGHLCMSLWFCFASLPWALLGYKFHTTPAFTLAEEVMWILVISEMIWWRGEESCGSQKSRWAQSDPTVLTGCCLQ